MQRCLSFVWTALFIPALYAQSLLDPTFGTGGLTTYGGTNSSDQFYELLVRPDGRLIALGRAGFDENEIVVCQFNADGTFDDDFGTAGVFQHGFSTQYDGLWAGVLTSDGSIVAAGYSAGAGMVCKITPDGALDTDFGTDGITALAGGNALDVHLLTDGRLLVAMTTGKVYRIEADGSIDATFITSTIPDAVAQMRVNDILALSDGTIVCSGLSGGHSGVAWLNADGSLATDHGDNGFYMPSDSGVVHSTLLLSDDRVLFVGRKGTAFTSDVALTQVLADGSLDPAFGDGGILRVDPDPTKMHAAFRAVRTDDGDYIVSGLTGDGIGTALAYPFLFKCHADGSPAPDLGDDGFHVEPTIPCGQLAVHGPTSLGHHIGAVLQPSGRLVLATWYKTLGMPAPDAGVYGLLMPTVNGVGSLTAIDAFSVAPNPASDLVRISFSTDDVASMIQLLDAQGRALRNWPVNGQRTMILDLHDLPRGLYLMRAIGKSAFAQRLVIQ